MGSKRMTLGLSLEGVTEQLVCLRAVAGCLYSVLPIGEREHVDNFSTEFIPIVQDSLPWRALESLEAYDNSMVPLLQPNPKSLVTVDCQGELSHPQPPLTRSNVASECLTDLHCNKWQAYKDTLCSFRLQITLNKTNEPN
ncbi:hypothetical protein KP509_25G073100 [Ceratopteris richardii]|uniref:Uncharacterized protein n=1 Tax=Ceratopteris richardii TaxID=49495 RepID=A0A8T2RRK4_CERRI|nr:hypothetical protein KP509_25G073100 [Ceratopteris richardii]